jgi:hypothetical protein
MDPPATVALSTHTSSTSRTYENPTSPTLRASHDFRTTRTPYVSPSLRRCVPSSLERPTGRPRALHASSRRASVTSKLSLPGSVSSGSLTSKMRHAEEPSAVRSFFFGGCDWVLGAAAPSAPSAPSAAAAASTASLRAATASLGSGLALRGFPALVRGCLLPFHPRPLGGRHDLHRPDASAVNPAGGRNARAGDAFQSPSVGRDGAMRCHPRRMCLEEHRRHRPRELSGRWRVCQRARAPNCQKVQFR